MRANVDCVYKHTAQKDTIAARPVYDESASFVPHHQKIETETTLLSSSMINLLLVQSLENF